VQGSKQVIDPPVALGDGGVRVMTLAEPEPVHPFVSVTVTLYVPAVLVLIVEVVAPVLQAYVFAPVPPDAFAVSVAELPGQTLSFATVTVGFGSMVNVPDVEPVQPFVSVTVTL
jgi:hypothetical protein